MKRIPLIVAMATVVVMLVSCADTGPAAELPAGSASVVTNPAESASSASEASSREASLFAQKSDKQKKFAKAKVAISGTRKVGSTLTAKPSFTPSSKVKYSYQWYRGTSKIKGATKKTYKLVADDAGKSITAKVTAKKPSYKNKTATSAKANIAKLKTFSTAKVTVSGTRKIGSTLTAKPSFSPSSKVKYGYQWYRGGSKIKNATKKTYKLVAGDTGKAVTVKVTAKKSGYANKTATSSKAIDYAEAKQFALIYISKIVQHGRCDYANNCFWFFDGEQEVSVMLGDDSGKVIVSVDSLKSGTVDRNGNGGIWGMGGRMEFSRNNPRSCVSLTPAFDWCP